MKTTVKKTFLDLGEEERWLNEQGAKGMMLLSYDGGLYEFEDVSPAAFQYKVDVPKYAGKEQRRDYLDFLEHAGISVVADYAGRVYLRKKDSGEPFELYTDSQSAERQLKKRTSHFFAIGFPQVALGAYFLVQAALGLESPAAFWITTVFGILFAASGTVFLVLGARARGKGLDGRASSREDRLIWEE